MGRDHGIHDIEVVVTLEGLDSEVSNLEGTVDAAKELSNLGDPEAFKVRSVHVRVFEQKGS